jgi:hypothetical protein
VLPLINKIWAQIMRLSHGNRPNFSTYLELNSLPNLKAKIAVFWDRAPCCLVQSARLHGATPHEAVNCILAAVRTWNLTNRKVNYRLLSRSQRSTTGPSPYPVHLCLPSVLIHLRFRIQFFFQFPNSSMHTTWPVHLIILEFIALIELGMNACFWSFSFSSFI